MHAVRLTAKVTELDPVAELRRMAADMKIPAHLRLGALRQLMDYDRRNKKRIPAADELAALDEAQLLDLARGGDAAARAELGRRDPDPMYDLDIAEGERVRRTRRRQGRG